MTPGVMRSAGRQRFSAAPSMAVDSIRQAETGRSGSGAAGHDRRGVRVEQPAAPLLQLHEDTGLGIKFNQSSAESASGAFQVEPGSQGYGALQPGGLDLLAGPRGGESQPVIEGP